MLAAAMVLGRLETLAIHGLPDDYFDSYLADIEAVTAGLAEGERATGTSARVIVDAMRHEADSLEVAETAAAFAGKGVVGFDLALLTGQE